MPQAFFPLPAPSNSTASSSRRPELQRPRLLSVYSHLHDREYERGNASIRYHRGAPVGADLTYGFEQREERDPEESREEHLDGLVNTLQEERRRPKPNSLVTWRGMLTRLLTAAYDDKGWEMTAVALDDVVYLEDYVTDEAFERRQEEEAKFADQSYQGYAFEAYSTHECPPDAIPSEPEDPAQPPGWSSLVNTNEQWCCVVKSGIEDVRLYMAGEVDCVEAKLGCKQGEWSEKMRSAVELKTNIVITNAKQQANFERKLLKHWAQSYLLGIPTIEVGFRTREGRLESVQRFETLRIPEMIASSPNAWSPQVCLDTFLYLARGILATVLPGALMSEDPAGDEIPEPVVWRLTFKPGKGLTIRRQEPLEDEYDGEGELWGFLPMDYVRQMLEWGQQGHDV